MKAKKYVRRIEEEETDMEGTWAVSYGDMVTLLLTFFILFFSLKPNNNEETTKGELDRAYPLSLALMGTLKQLTTNSSAESPSVTNPRNQNSGVQVDHEFIQKTKATVFKSGQKIIIDFPGISFFNSGKIPLTKAGEDTLKKFVTAYSPYMGNFNLVIQAFADIKKVKQIQGLKFSDNLELSALRGVSTLRYLQSAGIPLRQMKVAGYGELDLTKMKLEALPTNKKNPNNLLDLARRVVLVVEPQESVQ